MNAPAVRVKKARRPGRCPLCGGPVYVGQPIALMRAGGWAHTRCVIEAAEQTRTQPPADDFWAFLESAP